MSKEQTYIFLRNAALSYLAKKLPKPYKYVFSKLENELTLIVTKKCNLRCIYCYDKSNIPTKVNSCSYFNELKSYEIINLIKKVKRLGCYRIRITGGEPFLKDGIWEILKECKNMDVNICTNGTLLDKVMPKLKKLRSNFLRLHIHTSIDGIELHKKYRIGSDPVDIMNKVKLLRRNIPDAYISINTVLNRENIKELREVYGYLKLIGIDRWTISFPRFGELTKLHYFKVPSLKTLAKEFKKLYRLYIKDERPFDFTFSYFYKFEIFKIKEFKIKLVRKKDHPCLPDSNGCKGLIVDSFGNILDCLVLPPMLKDPINIKSCLKDHNNSSTLVKKIYESVKSPFYSLTIGSSRFCWSCRYRNLCRGGCPANKWWLTEKLEIPDPISCALFYIFERKILKHLSKKEKNFYKKLIEKSFPKKNIKKIIKNEKGLLTQIGLL